MKNFLNQYFYMKPIFASPENIEYPITPSTLLSSNPTCTQIKHLEDGSVRLMLTFESGMGVNIGSGMRITIGVNNEVSLLCTAVVQISPDSAIDRFTVNITKDKKGRIVTFCHAESSAYTLKCSQVIIETYDQFCENEDGTRQSIAEVMQGYQGQADKLRAYLTELKAKRNAAKLLNSKQP